MLQAPLADDLEIVEQDPDVDADRLGRAASRLTGAGRLLETLDGLDGDTRRRTRRLVVALLKESAALTLGLASDLEAYDAPARLPEQIASAPAAATLTVDLREPHAIAGTMAEVRDSEVAPAPVTALRAARSPATAARRHALEASDGARPARAHKKAEQERGPRWCSY